MSDPLKPILLVGCGRSGTGYASHLLNQNGIDCTHEHFFNVYRNRGAQSRISAMPVFGVEASWYAVPWLKEVPSSTKIIHIVREPERVLESFSRIGCFDHCMLRHLNYGFELKDFNKVHADSKAFLKRLNFVRLHREFLKRHCEAWQAQTELERLWHYWWEWNKKIENSSKQLSLPYYRLKLEDLVHDPSGLFDFLGMEKFVASSQIVNRKDKYKSRSFNLGRRPSFVDRMAIKYGY